MIIALNALAGRFLISFSYVYIYIYFSSEVLSNSFLWNIVLCFLIFPDSVFAPLYQVKEKGPSLEGMALCRNSHLGPARGCLSHLLGCLSSLIYSPQIPSVRGAPGPVSAPRGRSSFGTWFPIDWNLDFRDQLLKYAHMQVLWGCGCRTCWPPEQEI